MKRYYLYLICFITTVLNGQNLVPNPSFEYFTSCPAGGQFYKVSPWCGLGGGEDPYNTCNNPWGPGGFGVPNNMTGWQYPRTGDGYGSIALRVAVNWLPTEANRREYLHVPLTNTLSAGKMYCGKMYVNLINNDAYTTDRIGMFFSASPFACNQAMPSPQTIAPLNVTPQIANPPGNFITDTLNWIEVSGTFMASGGEAYLTIGDFYDDINTQTSLVNPSSTYNVIVFLIDDVSVEEISPAYCIANTSLCAPDSINLGTATAETAEYSWSPQAGLSCTNCPNPKAYVSQTTMYTLTKKQCKAITTANVTVTIKNDCNPIVTVPNVFTPNGDNVNDTFKIELYSATNVSFTIHNRWGNLIHSSNETDKQNILLWDGRTTSGEPCCEGVYFYTLTYTDTNGEPQSLKGYISLFR